MTGPLAARVRALQAALAAENAAAYGYGIVGAHLGGSLAAAATADWTAHQQARDQLAALIVAAKAQPQPAAVAYQLPIRVTGQSQALTLAAYLEDQVTAAYLALAAVPDPGLRQLAALAMQACAVRAARWSGQSQSFPGLPSSALLPASPAPA
jgi:Domain of unknown function (DUF4439)